MYFWIVRLLTRMPSLRSSPRIRSAPPLAILGGYRDDQRPGLFWQSRLGRSSRGLGLPDQVNALTVPAQESLRLNEQERLLPAANTGSGSTTRSRSSRLRAGRACRGAPHCPVVRRPAGGAKPLDHATPGGQVCRAVRRSDHLRRASPPHAQRDRLKPHLKEQWCIPPQQSAAFVWHLEDVLAVYTRPYDPRYPQICRRHIWTLAPQLGMRRKIAPSSLDIISPPPSSKVSLH